MAKAPVPGSAADDEDEQTGFDDLLRYAEEEARKDKPLLDALLDSSARSNRAV